jgi:DNA-binding XRE family transcriptional regulator
VTADRSTVETWTPDDWARLGTRVRSERERHGLSRNALAEMAGVSVGSIQSVELGTVRARWPQSFIRARWPQSLSTIEKALGWKLGSMKAILNGGEPGTLPAREPQPVVENDAVTVPAGLYADLVAITAHVSVGRSAAFVQGRPYPDALARRTLGALDDAGLLPDHHPDTRLVPEEQS